VRGKGAKAGYEYLPRSPNEKIRGKNGPPRQTNQRAKHLFWPLPPWNGVGLSVCNPLTLYYNGFTAELVVAVWFCEKKRKAGTCLLWRIPSFSFALCMRHGRGHYKNVGKLVDVFFYFSNGCRLVCAELYNLTSACVVCQPRLTSPRPCYGTVVCLITVLTHSFDRPLAKNAHMFL
jgi:hypothetical protein